MAQRNSALGRPNDAEVGTRDRDVSKRSLRLERGEEGSVSEVPYPYDLVRSGGD
jgi:hypothetical protein